MGLDYEQSLFFLGPPEQNARDTQMTTRVTERLPPWFLASRGFAAQHSCGRALPLLNLKKKRDKTRNTGEMMMGSNPVFRLVFHNSSLN